MQRPFDEIGYMLHQTIAQGKSGVIRLKCTSARKLIDYIHFIERRLEAVRDLKHSCKCAKGEQC